MKPIKVLVDVYYLNTALTGIKTYMLEFYEAINENKNPEIEFIFTHDPKKQASQKFFRGQLPVWKKLVYHLTYFYYKQLTLPLKVLVEKPDVLICFDFVAPALPLKCKKLVIIHDAFFWQMPLNYQKIWQEYFIAMIYAGLNNNTIVITTSNYSKKALQKHTTISKPIEVIYQCPKLLPRHANSDVLDDLRLKPKAYLLHVGSFDKRKMLPTLIEAFSLFNQINPEKLQLVLVGEKGLSSHLDDYKNVIQAIKNFEIDTQVILPGFLPDHQVKTLYENAFAYVFPSSNEGFGIPLIEAMFNNLPVLISDQEALVEIAGGAALSHPIGNAQKLSQDIALIYNDKAKYSELIKLGRERCKTFGRKAFSENFYRIITAD